MSTNEVNEPNEADEPEEEAPLRKSRGMLADMFVRLVHEKPLGLAGGIIVLLLLFAGIFANWLAPYGYNEVNFVERLMPPSSTFLLGTDNMGRDIMSRIIYGARISMIVGLAGAALHVIIETLVGGISGFVGGSYDTMVQRFVDTIQCFPSLIFYLTIMVIVGQGLIPVIFVLGISSGFYGARTIRSAVIGIKENVYVEAAKAIGASNARVMISHVLPNVTAVLIIEFTLAVGRMIIAEAMLSFLGFGVPPPQPSWGGMLSGPGRTYMLQAPWMALWPGLALAIAVYGVNMLGDAVRDLWDPRLRGGLGRYDRSDIKKERVMASAKS
jgi:peptide/nickel transport system permease protein